MEKWIIIFGTEWQNLILVRAAGKLSPLWTHRCKHTHTHTDLTFLNNDLAIDFLLKWLFRFAQLMQNPHQVGVNVPRPSITQRQKGHLHSFSFLPQVLKLRSLHKLMHRVSDASAACSNLALFVYQVLNTSRISSYSTQFKNIATCDMLNHVHCHVVYIQVRNVMVNNLS